VRAIEWLQARLCQCYIFRSKKRRDCLQSCGRERRRRRRDCEKGSEALAIEILQVEREQGRRTRNRAWRTILNMNERSSQSLQTRQGEARFLTFFVLTQCSEDLSRIKHVITVHHSVWPTIISYHVWLTANSRRTCWHCKRVEERWGGKRSLGKRGGMS